MVGITTIVASGSGLRVDVSRSGCFHGETDDFGFNVLENPVHVHDLHATLLHLLGLYHTKLTCRFQGRDFRLTDVHGITLHDLLV